MTEWRLCRQRNVMLEDEREEEDDCHRIGLKYLRLGASER